MIILSLHTGFHDGTAALFDGYDVLAAVQLERLTRKKGDGGGIPHPCIDEVLAIAGLAQRDVDVLVLSRASYPARYFRASAARHLNDALRGAFGRDKLRDITSELFKRQVADAGAIMHLDRLRAGLGLREGIPVFFSNHHFAHALSALFYTDWDEGLLYTADGCGDNVHYSMRHAGPDRLDCLFGDDRWLLARRRVDSLGLAYGFTTQALGYRMNRHEGKLTGLAAFGEPRLAEELGRHFRVDDEGLINTDFESDGVMRAEIVRLAAGQAPEHVAASIQKVLEDSILASVRRFLTRTRSRRLGLAGGVFSNVRLNRLLCEATDIDEIFVFPGMGDEGLAIGGALEFLLDRDGLKPWMRQRRRLGDVYWGRDWNGRIDETLSTHADLRPIVAGDPVETAAALVARGFIGAIYEGRMEFGPRALGARSILASPIDAAVNKDLNARLERTEFMPFAPYVLADDAEDVFEITPRNRYACNFMTITTAVRPAWRERIPAVVHVDGTARPQILRADVNPLYASILKSFKRRTGLPVLINTSFNVHEEPIVNRPEECRRALLDRRIDFVVTRSGVYGRADANWPAAAG